jgi:hypothetical protein
MKATHLATALTIIPALLAAQQTGTSAATASSTSASASAQASISVPATYSTESKAKIDAAFQAAKSKNLPDESMRQRIAEGQAKGASEAQVVAAVQSTQTRLEASQTALIRAGHANPQPDEVASGEQAMARGATEGQIEALVKRAPDRSVAVALDVLAKLQANGQPIDQALAQVGAQLDAKAPDQAIQALVNVNGILPKKP